jgi:hypothetical protein
MGPLGPMGLQGGGPFGAMGGFARGPMMGGPMFSGSPFQMGPTMGGFSSFGGAGFAPSPRLPNWLLLLAEIFPCKIFHNYVLRSAHFRRVDACLFV